VTDTATVRAPRSRRVLAALCIVFLFVLLLCIPTFCVGGPGYYSSKYSPVRGPRPTGTAAALIPEVQTEPHTCGLHALSSIYRAYGLDAEQFDLRFRLGTDKPLTNFAADSTGTLPPDIERVVRQDGFILAEHDPAAPETAEHLLSHLQRGHAALVLTHKGSLTTGLHWIALSASPDRGGWVRVCDSLKPEPFEEDAVDLLSSRARTLYLLSPRTAD
jgi:hypothetical protein